MAVVSLLLAGLAALLGSLWVYISWNFNYWSKRGVPSANALSLFGDRGGGLPFGKPFWTNLSPIYRKYKPLGHRYAGFFQARRPVLVVLDPELAKTVLTKEFSSFQGRGQPFDEEGDPLSVNLVNLVGPRWKNLRSKLSPVFTSGKLKLMFPLMRDVSDRLDARLRELRDAEGAGGEVEMRDLLFRYATDVIGSVAFGIKCDSLAGAEDEFYDMSREVFNRNLLFILRFFLASVHPAFVKLLPFKSVFSKATSFFITLMRETVQFRTRNKVNRDDLVKLMMQLRETDLGETDRLNHVEFNETTMAGTAFLFFIAGLDAVANTVGFALHHLALEPHWQQRVAEEVRACKARHGGAITYEAVRDMELVDRVIQETLRLYSPGVIITREPDHAFKLPDSDIVIDNTAMVWIPVYEMMHDPEYFPDPERFDPDRFTEEAKRQRHSYVYLPFGEGPRFCIAERFATLELKLCLAGLIDKQVFSVGRKTEPVPALDPSKFAPSPKNGFWLKAQDRTTA